MFTVLIRYQKTKREVLIPAREVEYVPQGEDGAGLLIRSRTEGESNCHLGFSEKNDDNWRDVFVMNEHGQTVARYEL